MTEVIGHQDLLLFLATSRATTARRLSIQILGSHHPSHPKLQTLFEIQLWAIVEIRLPPFGNALHLEHKHRRKTTTRPVFLESRGLGVANLLRSIFALCAGNLSSKKLIGSVTKRSFRSAQMNFSAICVATSISWIKTSFIIMLQRTDACPVTQERKSY